MMLTAQSATDPVTTGLLQYGAIGILALIALLVAYRLWQTQQRSYDKEVERGDRLERQLTDLNKLITSELSGHLVRATEAMREVTDILKHRGDR